MGCYPTRSQQQWSDVVGVEDSDQMIERADEPAAGVRVLLHQVIHLQKSLLCALHLGHKCSALTHTECFLSVGSCMFCSAEILSSSSGNLSHTEVVL